MTLTERLDEVSDGDPPVGLFPPGTLVWSGMLSGFHFIATQDDEGCIMVSLSHPSRARVTPSQAKSFFRRLGHKPITKQLDMPLSSVWVMRAGNLQ